MKRILLQGLHRVRLAIQEFGPYLALVLLPGGSLIAAATWIYRHRPDGGDRS